MTQEGRFFAQQAWLGGRDAVRDVLITVSDQTITQVEVGVQPERSVQELTGLTMPGFANVHSHAFHRVLRGRADSGATSFWSWRDLMYQVANLLTPDSYYHLAKAVFGEMLCAGTTLVGEFHYLHHQPDGVSYSNPNAMGAAVLAAAKATGIRITLIDALYLHGGLGSEGYLALGKQQRRFSDGSVEAWASRMETHELGPQQKLGAAAHSVRAVDPVSLLGLATFTAASHLPTHVHLSEQPEENQQAVAVFQKTPTQLLADAGLLNALTTAIHATHLTSKDVGLLSRSQVGACFCPTTERDLADGIGPSVTLSEAGSPISLGSDSNAVIDPFEEMRGLEMNQRLHSGNRGNHSPSDLATFATANGYRALGWGGNSIAVGQLADFITINTESVRTAGPGNVLDSTVLSATTTDVTTVVVGGRVVVPDTKKQTDRVAKELSSVLSSLAL